MARVRILSPGRFRRRAGAFLAAGSALALAGCTAVDPAPRFAELRGIARPATDAPLIWERTPDDAAELRAAVASLLEDGLTRSAAIRIALLRSPALQAGFEEIGIAEAERVQAGLLTNPSFSLILTFPLNLGDVSATLLGLLSDLWMTPVNEAIAEHALEGTLQRVAAKVVGTAAAAGAAYDSALYWSERVALEREKLRLRRDRLDAVRTKAGSDRDGSREAPDAEKELVDQELGLAFGEKELANARIELEMALGLAEGESLPPLVDGFDVPPRGEWSSERVVPFAMQNRFDVAAAAAAVKGAEEALERERRRVYGEVAIGPSYEGGFGDFDGGGPAIGLELPIFDQNQARIARAELQLRRQRRLLEELRLRARGEVLAALAEAEYRRRRAAVLAERSAAVARLARAGAESALRTGESSPREELLETRRQALDSVAELRRAETDLQIALWGARAN